ncbi:MAG TPA: asparagine synthase (glutamine-hydrolyzing), partial [Gemmatimonadales bacterium]
MCGICGWIGPGPSDASCGIEPMLAALAKRGPDDSRVWRGEDGRAVLGHTRLSIIDLAGSLQPMCNEDGKVRVTFNGEIYNFAELRRGLVSRGHVFRTHGDTEVLVHLYEEAGREMVSRLDGMFAFGVYDARRHSLLLARDRIGIKPLFYWHDRATGGLLFASDMSAMLANRAVPRVLEPRALAQYLHFGFVAHPLSWLRDVRQLQPGETLEWRDGEISLARYYSWSYQPDQELASARRAQSALHETLAHAVGSHLVSDVPLGSFLSSGLDSTTVTGLAQRERAASADPISSFTVRFWSATFDESDAARSIAGDLGTEHTEIDAAELRCDRATLDQIVDGLGEPFGDQSALAVFQLCREARPHVKVALSGDGGDEIFLGYRGFLKQRLARRFRVMPRVLRRLGAASTMRSRSSLPRRLHKYLSLSLHDDPGIILDWHRRWRWSHLETLLGPDLFEELFASDDPFPGMRETIGPGADGGFLEQQIRFHMHVVLPCDALFKVDRMSMAHGMEVRVPLLANDMLDYGARLPLEMRADGRRTKEPLRSIAETLSPTVARHTGKRGFGFPVDTWMRGRITQQWR